MSSHQIPGPGNYNPPVDNTPSALPGQPGSGQQLIKHYLLHSQEQQKQQDEMMQQHHHSIQEEMLRQQLINAHANMQQQQQQQQQQQHFKPDPTVLPSNILQHRNSAAPFPSRRQDLLTDVLPSAAVGALTSGLTPISIFSNLLNAYATLDSKHDITGMYFISHVCVLSSSYYFLYR